MTDLTPKQAAHLRFLRDSGILPTVQEQIKRLTAPIHWFGVHTGGGYGLLDSASICFVDTGTRLLGLSAQHVHAAVVALLDRDASARCQLGGCTFDPRDRVIDASTDLDLVTYDVSEIQVNQAEADIHYAKTWPPEVEPQGLMFVGGWVDALREEHEDRTTHHFLHIAAYCDSVSGRQIGVPVYTSSSHPWGERRLPPGTELGGLSGGPVFQVIENPLTQLFLVGIVYEYSPSFEIALARPLSLISSEGQITG